LRYQGFPHPIYIHNAARSEVKYRFFQPSRTICVDAPADGLAFGAHDLASANRAMPGHAEWRTMVALPDDANHFGDNVTGALH
jgi:hypothetical protein